MDWSAIDVQRVRDRERDGKALQLQLSSGLSAGTHTASQLSLALRSNVSRHPYLHPHLHSRAADGALVHLGRAVGARALVAARHRDVRLEVGEADDARRLAADGRLGRLRPASAELRVGERRHGGGRRRRRHVQRHRSRR